MTVEINFSDGRKIRQEYSKYIVEDSWGKQKAMFDDSKEAFIYAETLRPTWGILPLS